jgi:hypothetical protein
LLGPAKEMDRTIQTSPPHETQLIIPNACLLDPLSVSVTLLRRRSPLTILSSIGGEHHLVVLYPPKAAALAPLAAAASVAGRFRPAPASPRVTDQVLGNSSSSSLDSMVWNRPSAPPR